MLIGVHKAAMDIVRENIKRKFFVDIGEASLVECMWPDFPTNEHYGYNVHSSNSSHIFDYFKLLLSTGTSNNNELRLALSIICHHLVDIHSVGQICNDFKDKRIFGRDYDDLLDLFGEFVNDKKKYQNNVYNTKVEVYSQDSTDLISRINSSIVDVYVTYKRPAGSWFFIFSRDFRKMVRHAIADAASFTSNYYYLFHQKKVYKNK